MFPNVGALSKLYVGLLKMTGLNVNKSDIISKICFIILTLKLFFYSVVNKNGCFPLLLLFAHLLRNE